MVRVGQGLLGKLAFKDGTYPTYSRPFLVAYVNLQNVGVLNVSSVVGKEHKLLFSSNMHIKNYKPPFIKDSFVKLDSLVYITLSEASNMTVLHNGDCLDQHEMNTIISKIIF